MFVQLEEGDVALPPISHVQRTSMIEWLSSMN